MSVSRADLLGLYLAYFGRPPDPGGVSFYTSRPAVDIWSVAASFSASAEAQSLYGSGFGAAQINAIYQNLFNRDAEPAGLLYWSNEVASGHLTPAGAAYAIFLGARNEDANVAAYKVSLGDAFLAALDKPAEVAGYAGADAAARGRAFIHDMGYYGTATTPEQFAAWLDAEVAFACGLQAQAFKATKDAAGVVTFTDAGCAISVSLSGSTYTFTTSAGNTGTATVSGPITGVVVPWDKTLTVGSSVADSWAFSGDGRTVVVASASGEDLATHLTATGMDAIQLTSGHDYSMSLAQMEIARIGAAGTPGSLADSGAMTVVDTLASVATIAASLKADHGIDKVIATVASPSDISGTATAGIDGIELLGAGNYSMTSGEAALLAASPGAQTVTLTTAASSLALSGEVETFKLAGGVANSVVMGATGQVVTGGTGNDEVVPITGVTSASDLGGGDNIVRVTAGLDISKGTFAATGGVLEYDVDAASTATMTLAQVAGITSATGTQDITLADAAVGVTLDKDIETFTLGDFANSVTMGGKAQAVVGGNGADTVTAIDGVTSTSDLGKGANVVIVQNGFDVSHGTFLATGGTVGFVLDGDATATLSAAQAAQVSSATGTQTVTLGTAATGQVLAAAIENFALGNFTNSVVLGAAAQDVAGNAGSDRIDISGVAATGTLDGAGGSADTLVVGGTAGAAQVSHFETLAVSADADVTAINGGAALGTATLAMAAGADLAMTIAQNEGMKASATVAGSGQSVTLSQAGAATAIAGVETYVLAAGDNTITTSTAGQTIDAHLLAAGDVLTLSGSTAVAVSLGDADLVATGYTGAVTVASAAGANTIALGTGADTVLFNSLAGADTVAGFSAAADHVQLSRAVFAAFGSTGSLAPSAFESGAGLTAAATATGHVIYDTSTGDLYYDADGHGGSAAVLIGTFSGAPALAASVFSIVA